MATSPTFAGFARNNRFDGTTFVEQSLVNVTTASITFAGSSTAVRSTVSFN